MTERTTLILGLLAGLGLVGCLVSWFSLLEAQAASADTAVNLDRMVSLAESIDELRTLKSSAQMIGEQKIENSQTFIAYGADAGIAERQVSEFNRLPLTKIKNTSYSRDDVYMRIGDTTLRQVVQYLLRLSDASVGYLPTSVHLRARPGKLGSVEKWNVELLLTRVLYTATNQPSE